MKVKFYAVRMPNGKLRLKIYQHLGHAKNAARLRPGAVVIEFDAVKTNRVYKPRGEDWREYYWEVENEDNQNN